MPVTPSPSSPSSSSNMTIQGHPTSTTTPFHSYPQKYPRARQKAAQVASQVVEVMRRGPRTMIGTVVDTQFHANAGYVLATTQLGIVQVYGAPPGSIAPGMRLYCRQFGGMRSTHAFVFDGLAPNLSGLGTSGSFLLSSPASGSGQAPLASSSGGVPSVSGLSSSVGYYWHAFFYLPSVPASPVTLFAFAQSSSSNVLLLEYLPTGVLRLRDNTNTTPALCNGYVTTSGLLVAPHSVHWVVVQPGLTSNELLVDGVASSYSAQTGSSPTFAGGGATYTLSLFANGDGSSPCPVGTWISKLGYGSSYSGSPLALSAGTSIPAATDDSDIPLLASGANQHTIARYLCADLTNSVLTTPLAGSLTTTAYTTVSSSGPY